MEQKLNFKELENQRSELIERIKEITNTKRREYIYTEELINILNVFKQNNLKNYLENFTKDKSKKNDVVFKGIEILLNYSDYLDKQKTNTSEHYNQIFECLGWSYVLDALNHYKSIYMELYSTIKQNHGSLII